MDRIIGNICDEIRKKRPLVHCITNAISINQCANAVLAVGARPIMAEHPLEVGEITESSDALMLNMGNITDTKMESMLISAKIARNNDIPIILDVVGVACSNLRKKYFAEILEKAVPTVIKGNYSEIFALYSEEYYSSGIDADVHLSKDVVRSTAEILATKYNTVILASGKTDIITNGIKTFYVNNGTSRLSTITGTGCMLGALCASCLTVEKSMIAAVAACVILGICGELSMTDRGNGTFFVNLMDELSVLNKEKIEKYVDLEVVKNERV